MARTVHLAVALDGAGWHPAAWRQPEARPDKLFSPGYWTDLVGEAERGLLDFVTIEDALDVQSGSDDGADGRTDRVRGRLDAVLIASRVAPRTTHIGLVPTAVVTHTEPFHISKAVATLDHASTGRAGWRPQVTRRPSTARNFGRRDLTPTRGRSLPEELFAEAGDHVDVVRKLWDSWEDDAEIRDAATGRFIDRDKLHYIDFQGEWFDVKGPSITPRPPQGQPLVVALAHNSHVRRWAAHHADVVFITPYDAERAADEAREIRAETADPPHVFGDLEVYLDDDAETASRRKALLDERDPGHNSDAPVFTGTPAQLADQLAAWAEAGLTGFRLRPATLPHDLVGITRGLVPQLRQRGLFRDEYEAATLRGLLGLDRPANRYASGGAQQ